MKTRTTGLCAATAALALGAGALGQVWEENFDDYELGVLIGQDCDPDCDPGASWQSWDDNPDAGLAEVVDDESRSPSQSLAIVGAGGSGGTGDDDMVRTYNSLKLTSGVYAYTAYQYIPVSAVSGATWFNLMNTYPASANPDWSMATTFDAANDVVEAWAGGGTLPLVKGRWVELRIIINLDTDNQKIFYDGDLLVDKSWTGGVAEGGALNIAAVDLYGGSGDFQAFYDDMSIVEIDPIGGCCHEDGTCDPDVTEETCEATEDGFFLGIGSPCGKGDANCPTRGPNGWELTAPFEWDGSGTRALGAHDDCDEGEFFGGAPDDSFLITIPWAQRWTFDACITDVDLVMALGDGGACAQNRRVIIDSAICADALGALFQEDFVGTATVVNLTAEDEAGPGGNWQLDVYAQCARIELAGTDDGEACGEVSNDGCNGGGENAVTPIACGDTITGSTWFDGGARDTDWLALTIDADTQVTITGSSVFSGHWFGVINDGDTQDCDAVETVNIATTAVCQAGDREAVLEITLENTDRDGGDPDTTTWWLFVAPDFGGPVQPCDTGWNVGGEETEDVGDPIPADIDGQNGYSLTLTCSTTECTGDADEDGDTDFQDLLLVLANFGCDTDCGARDVDSDGDVDFQDVLTVLANFGCGG